MYIILIGELAKKTNISKRTLHYYEQIELLQPTHITDNGYRYYDETAILRLQRILLLKSIGYTLEQIKELLQKQNNMGENENWVASLQEQIELIEQKKEELTRKQYYLRSTIQTVRFNGMTDLEQLLRIISHLENRPLQEGIIPPDFSDELHLTSQEIDIFNQLPVLGSNDPRMEQLLTIFERVGSMMPSSPHTSEAQIIAGQLYELGLELFAGDETLLNKYWALIQPGDHAAPVVMGMDNEFMSYVDEMISFFLKQREDDVHE
ncbi:MerR family transcriptional regulator [Paenibacillus barcinonensis]|uniref:DNA-binding transcriptional MerR regulator n=1 Tax=Paenibacillus barcinonensis TaxID=198119 RepID=A0A2V4V870_PAEBA|nr:MerR family transcriptional regulator [Paenibacillus barcinonensis]PYE48039.1 DNA-binding transcriptional MerR regulator [Paenibacillus barcinonensis]QKS55153.1 MerR family transcriptional regulator [Paenibacillus barcinonensis]